MTLFFASLLLSYDYYHSCLNIPSRFPCSWCVACNLLTHLSLNFYTAAFYSPESLYLMHIANPTGIAVSRCITWFQIQLILTTFQIRYHTRPGIIVALDSSET